MKSLARVVRISGTHLLGIAPYHKTIMEKKIKCSECESRESMEAIIKLINSLSKEEQEKIAQRVHKKLDSLLVASLINLKR